MFTFAIFSCNRLHYLRNCVESVRQFVGLDAVRLLVVDNASTEPGMSDYLASLPKAVSVHRFRERCPGELYRAMNLAVQFARDQDSPFIHFLQEDCQFLWRDPSMLANLAELFERCPRVAQARCNFAWRGKLAKWTACASARALSAAGQHWFQADDLRPCDTGFTRVALFDSIGPFPQGTTLRDDPRGLLAGEDWLTQASRSKGWIRVESLRPSIGMLPDAAHVRGMDRIGAYFPPPREYYLKPLDPDRIATIERLHATQQVPVAEDFQIPDGWQPQSSQIRSTLGRERLPAG